MDWGGDYSLLLHSIEGKISSSQNLIPPEASANSAANQFQSDSIFKERQKRIRLSEDISSEYEFPSSSLQFTRDYQRSSCSIDCDESKSNNIKRGDIMKMSAEVDELRLANEQLKDQNNILKDDNERMKDKLLRQMTFLEAENTQLKKFLDDKNEKYYEEKKKWQAKFRSLEAENARLTSASKAMALRQPPGPPAAVVTTSATSSASWQQKFLELEKAVHAKSQELRAVSSKNAFLEERIQGMKQELSSTRGLSSLQQQQEEEVLEARELRKRCAELEKDLRSRSRDISRLESKQQNQSRLEEEISALETKLQLSQASVHALKDTEGKYLVLVQEKEDWNNIFKTSVSSTVRGTSEVNPAVVLRSLSEAQRKCSLLLQVQGDLECNMARLQSALHVSEESVSALQTQLTREGVRVLELAAGLKAARETAGMFEGEVSTLRVLLRSYDSEFQVGRSGVRIGIGGSEEGVLGIKERVIEGLRRDLDGCRGQLKAFIEQGVRVQAQGAAVPVVVEDNMDVIDKDKEGDRDRDESRREVGVLRDLYEGLQTYTRTDVLPGYNKVLHMVDNPFSSLRALKYPQQSSSSSNRNSTIPIERLKQLRQENKDLKNSLNELAPSRPAAGTVRTAGLGGFGLELDATSSDSMLNAAAGSSSSSSADSNKLNQRLKEMFKERITSFREAVYLLTGYKVDLYNVDIANGGHRRLRLRSMFAESPEDDLLFQWREDNLELLETPFVSKIDPKLFTYLTSCNSVPAFLANLTSELFESQTFQG